MTSTNPFLWDGVRTIKVPLFPCRQCGHQNRPAESVRESLKLWLMDKLPPCRKCGLPLKRFDFRHEIPADFAEMVRCPDCGATNRILRGYRAQMKCGRCKSSLLPPHLRELRSQSQLGST